MNTISTTHELARVLDQSGLFEWVKLFPKGEASTTPKPSYEDKWHKDYSATQHYPVNEDCSIKGIETSLNQTLSYEEAERLSQSVGSEDLFELGHAEDVLSVSTDSPITRSWVGLTADNHLVIQYDPLEGERFNHTIVGGHWVVPISEGDTDGDYIKTKAVSQE